MDTALLDPRIAAKVQRDMFTGCLRWMGRKDEKGYPLVYIDGKSWRVHRYTWTQVHGPIPPGIVLDHVRARGCQFRDCIDCDHLEPVTPTINAKRVIPWNRLKTHCPQGHAYDELATVYGGKDGYVRRYCSACREQRKYEGRSLKVVA